MLFIKLRKFPSIPIFLSFYYIEFCQMHGLIGLCDFFPLLPVNMVDYIEVLNTEHALGSWDKMSLVIACNSF